MRERERNKGVKEDIDIIGVASISASPLTQNDKLHMFFHRESLDELKTRHETRTSPSVIC